MLPAARTLTHNQVKKSPREILEELPFDPVEIRGPLSELPSVRLRLVQGRASSRLFTDLMNKYHYLGYQWSVGRSVKYLFEMGHEIIGGMSWGSGSRKFPDLLGIVGILMFHSRYSGFVCQIRDFHRDRGNAPGE